MEQGAACDACSHRLRWLECSNCAVSEEKVILYTYGAESNQEADFGIDTRYVQRGLNPIHATLGLPQTLLRPVWALMRSSWDPSGKLRAGKCV